MLPLLFLIQVAAAPETVYASTAVRAIVARAAVENHAPPAAFRGYGARVESELSLIIRDTAGRENAAQIEQLASHATWTLGGPYEMHIVGYRSQGVGVPYSTLSFVRGWTVPSLYGERLRLGILAPPSRDSSRDSRDSIIAVHPFAEDRDLYYRFSGGDTVGTVRSVRRVITIVRVHIVPRFVESKRVALFEGDIQLDLERGQIVRMRGRFLVGGGTERRPFAARMPGNVAAAYCDFTNAEIDGAYWLPASQRTEFQATIALFGRSRAVMRVSSEFSDFSLLASDSGVAQQGQQRFAHVTTWAPRDSVAQFDDWHTSLGTITGNVSAADFDDIAPDAWRVTGAPRVDFVPSRTDRMLGFDRVGGLYTGLEGTLSFRDLAPGLTLRGDAGWAWTEKTVRGGAGISRQRAAWTYGAFAERRLLSTNDFLRPFEPDAGGFAALISSIDDFDYVDRSRAMLSFAYSPDAASGSTTLQLGAGRDANEQARLTRGIFASSAFRPNRSAASGSYAIATLNSEWHPSVSGDFVHPGLGARLSVEAARGGLSWTRAQVALSGRRSLGAITLAFHADGGVVAGSSIPPQTLFELGGTGSLFGYAYKEFAGDRAALFRGYSSYTFPIWHTPVRAWRNFFVPGLAPGLAMGISGGWTEVSSSAAQQSVLALNALPLPSATHGIRATAGAGLTFFGGNLHIGAARALDANSRWRLAIGLGQDF